MRTSHVISAVVGAAAMDIGKAILVDEAESVILKALAALWAWLKSLFGGQSQQPGWGVA